MSLCLRGRPRTNCRSFGRSIHLLALAVLLLISPAAGVGAEEAGPTAVVSTFQDRLLATMKEGRALGFAGRYQRLLPAMEDAFDLPQMARIVVGARWAKMSEAERTQVVDLFREFSVSTYASEFSDFGGERFETGGEQIQAGLGTIVETRLILTDGAPIALNYLLRQTPAGWRIVDVYLAGTISELARRRDEFASIIRSHGVDGLIALLRKKNQELAGS
ncbi:MAG: ABC transporter substrate-binding protein [Dongiaceae bacterium]